MLLHTVVLATVVWPQWLPPRIVAGCGVTLGLLWLAAVGETRGELRRLAAEQSSQAIDEAADSRPPLPDHQETTDTLFTTAQNQYLQADWVTTEQTLLELLRLDSEDIEAGLLLATLWRRIGRTRDARRRLRWLARRELAYDWRFEIDAEFNLCDEQDGAPVVETVAETVAEELATPLDETAPGGEPINTAARNDTLGDDLSLLTLQSAEDTPSKPLETIRKAA